MSSQPSLSRRTSLVDFLAALPKRTRLPSLRSKKSTSSLNQSTVSHERYRSYSVYSQSMGPAILRDQDATAKLLECILESPGGRRSLSRLARTCKSFKEPALDILWRDLDSLNPLLSLFPSNLLRRSRRPGLGLTKTPEPADWNKLLEYGERVRSVAYLESSGNVSPTIFPTIEEHRPRTWLLPRLTSLTWKAETAAGLERCRLFLSPELQTVVLEIGSKPPKLDSILTEIASHTRLTSFSFTLHTNLPDRFTEILEPDVALEKLALTAPGALSSKVGKWASALPALRSFALDLTGRTTTAVEGFFDEISPDSGYSTPSSVGGTDSGVFSGDELDFSEMRKSAVRLVRDGPRTRAFAQLSQLQLTGDVANIVMFLQHITCALTQLDLAIDDPPMQDDWRVLCALISERFSHSLQSIRISATSASRFAELVRTTSRGGDTPMHHLPLTHFQSLPHLYRFEVDLPESVIFHNGDISHMARICPSLEVLRLSPQARYPQPSGPPFLTLEGLVPLTRDCRRLHTLAVVVNALEGSASTFASRAPSSRSLLRLNVGHSWIKDPLQTTILLSHMAPYLENLKWFNERNRAGIVEANALAWQKVAEFLPHIQNVRLLERSQIPQPPPPPKVDVYVPPPTSEKEVDATVQTVDQEVWAQPVYHDGSVQVAVESVEFAVQAYPEMISIEIDATPVVVDEEVSGVPEVVEQSVGGHPEEEAEVDHISTSSSVEGSDSAQQVYLPILTFVPNKIMSLTLRVVRFYTSPIRYVFSFMPSMPIIMHKSIGSGEGEKGETEGEDKAGAEESDQEKRMSPPSSPTHDSDIIMISPVCQ